jgi:hypothetical protein
VLLFELESRFDPELVPRIEHALHALALQPLALHFRWKVGVRDVLDANGDVQGAAS